MALGDAAGIFMNALGSAGQSASQKAARTALQRQGEQRYGETLNNDFISMGVFTQGEDGKTEVDLSKIHNTSTKAYLDLMNRNNRGRAYYDSEGNEVTGKFVSKPRQVTNPDGTKGFILEIETRDGEIKPITLNRSAEGEDVPAVLDQSALELLYTSQFDNSVTNDGISGRAVGLWKRDLALDSRDKQIRALAAQGLTDPNVPPDQLLGLLNESNELLKQLEPNRGTQPTGLEDSGIKATGTSQQPKVDPAVNEEIITLKNELKSITNTGRQQARGNRGKYKNPERAAEIEARLNALGQQGASDQTKQLVQQSGGGVEESQMQSVSDLSPEDQETWTDWWNSMDTVDKALLVSNGLLLIPGAGWAVGGAVKAGLATVKFAPKILQGVKNLGVKSVTRPVKGRRVNTNQEMGPAAKQMGYSDKFDRGREFSAGRAATTSTAAGAVMAGANAIRGTGGDMEEQTPALSEPNRVMQIPTDVDGATQWFANPDNQQFIDNLPPDQVQKIKGLLDGLNVKKKQDLIKAKQDGLISDSNYRAAATLIAWSVVDKNGLKDPAISMQIYRDFINEAETGNPAVTGDAARKTALASGKLSLDRQKFAKEIQDDADIFDDLKAVYTAGINDDGERDFGNAEYIGKMKVAGIQMQDKVRNNTATEKEMQAYDLLVMERMRNEADKLGSEDFKDWFLDWVARSSANENTISTGFEGLRVIRSGGKPSRIVFTTLTTQGTRAEAEQSMSYSDFIRMAGSAEAANYLIARMGG